jgi:hypothetical protein
MGNVYSELRYESAGPEMQAKVKALIAKEIQPWLDQGVTTFRVAQYTGFAIDEDKKHVTFPVSLYEEVCREIIKVPYCIRKKHHHAYEIMIIQTPVVAVKNV